MLILHRSIFLGLLFPAIVSSVCGLDLEPHTVKPLKQGLSVVSLAYLQVEQHDGASALQIQGGSLRYTHYFGWADYTFAFDAKQYYLRGEPVAIAGSEVRVVALRKVCHLLC